MARINLWNPQNDTHRHSPHPKLKWCKGCEKHLEAGEFVKGRKKCRRCLLGLRE